LDSCCNSSHVGVKATPILEGNQPFLGPRAKHEPLSLVPSNSDGSGFQYF
jgi:hypothetical protein